MKKQKADTFDALSGFLERLARITGTRYQKIKRDDGLTEMQFSVPITPEYLPLLMAAIPAVIIEQAIEPIVDAIKNGRKVPPNDSFEGKKRF